jgi:hypothetical protein
MSAPLRSNALERQSSSAADPAVREVTGDWPRFTPDGAFPMGRYLLGVFAVWLAGFVGICLWVLA